MRQYLIKRFLAVIPTMLVLLFMVVGMLRLLPSDAVDVLLAEAATQGGSAELSRNDREAIERRLGLDKPIHEEYFEYTLSALRGDLGTSIWSQRPVADMVRAALPVTIFLAILALVWGILLGVGIGIFSAVWQNSPLDLLLRGLSILGLSIPNFALATFVIVMPTLWWNWSPPVFYSSFSSDDVWGYISQYITPALVLGLALSAALMRLTRTMMLEVLRQDFVRTARAKGLPERRVILGHALRNALIPVVSLLGLQVAFLLSGTVIIEAVFGLPGMGRLLVSALNERNYPVVQGVTVMAGMIVILTNLTVDLSYGYLNPRVRVEA